MIALLADPLWLALISALGLARALTSRKATPLDAVLGRIPWPGRRTRKDSPCTPAASTASTTSATRRTTARAPKAATTTNRRTASLLDALTWPLRLREPTGQHCALTLRFGSDGLLRHGEDETGPMPKLTDDQLWREIERTRSPA